MNHIELDRHKLRLLVETYGKEDVLKYVHAVSLNESAATSTSSIIADAIVMTASKNEMKLDLSKNGFAKTYNAVNAALRTMRIQPEMVARVVINKFMKLGTIPAFNAFISQPEVASILDNAGVIFEKKNADLYASDKEKERAELGAEMQQELTDMFDFISLDDYSWQEVVADNGIMDNIIDELVAKFPILRSDEYADLLYNSLVWVVRTNFEDDPVLVMVANDEYAQACIEGDEEPVKISKYTGTDGKNSHGHILQCIYSYNVRESESGESGYYEARPCTLGHFIESPKPSPEENDVNLDDLDY